MIPLYIFCIVGAFIGGGLFGILIMALFVVAKDNRENE